MQHSIDVICAKAAPSNALLLGRIAGEWVKTAFRVNAGHNRSLCLAKAAYWRSVKQNAFPGRARSEP